MNVLNISIGCGRSNTKVAAIKYEVFRISTMMHDAQRRPVRIRSHPKIATVGLGLQVGQMKTSLSEYNTFQCYLFKRELVLLYDRVIFVFFKVSVVKQMCN